MEDLCAGLVKAGPREALEFFVLGMSRIPLLFVSISS